MLSRSHRRRGFRYAAVARALLAACTAATAQAGSAGGWITYWDFERGLARARSAPGKLRDVLLFAAELAPDGSPVLAVDASRLGDAVQVLRNGGARVWLTCVNDVRPAPGEGPRLKDAGVVHRVLEDAEVQRAHRRTLVELARLHGLHGIDVDYENLAAEDRALFTRFAEELAWDLAAKGLALSVTVQPKRRESRSAGPGSADWARLCRAADRLQVMLYNLHSRRTGPGPMATSSWMRDVMGYAAAQCEREKIVPVLKVSGMDWGPRGAQGVRYSEAMARLPEGARFDRDPDGGSPYFTYEGTDGAHTVYFEDATSILEKIEVLRRLGFEQVVLWSLGPEDPELLARLPAPDTPTRKPDPSPGQKPSRPEASKPHPR